MKVGSQHPETEHLLMICFLLLSLRRLCDPHAPCRWPVFHTNLAVEPNVATCAHLKYGTTRTCTCTRVIVS